MAAYLILFLNLNILSDLLKGVCKTLIYWLSPIWFLFLMVQPFQTQFAIIFKDIKQQTWGDHLTNKPHSWFLFINNLNNHKCPHFCLLNPWILQKLIKTLYHCIKSQWNLEYGIKSIKINKILEFHGIPLWPRHFWSIWRPGRRVRTKPWRPPQPPQRWRPRRRRRRWRRPVGFSQPWVCLKIQGVWWHGIGFTTFGYPLEICYTSHWVRYGP